MVEEKETIGTDYLKWFSEIDLDSENSVGKKASRLAFLYKNKIPVLDGFVLTYDAVDKLFEIWDVKEKFVSLLRELKDGDIEFEKFKEDIKKIIMNEDFPEEILQEIFESYEVLSSNKYDIEVGSALDILKSSSEYCFVAVRSSPEVKIESENSFLNVKGKSELVKAIKQAIISNYYDYDSLERNNFEFFGSGIVIQKMIQSDKSGFVFSESSDGKILVEGIWGFGLGLDLEDINKDKYFLSKELEILDIKVNEKNFAFVRDSSGKEKVVKLRPERSSFQALNTYEIQRVADLALKSEFLFKFPIKLQFAIEEDEIFITNVFDLDIKKSGNESEIIKSNVEITPLSVFTKTKIELILDDFFDKESLKKTNVKKAGLIKLEGIFEKAKRHRDYYLSYELYKDYRIMIEENLKEVISVFDENYVSVNNLLSDSFKRLQGSGFIKEENPRLGIHGIRYGLKYPDMLDAEIGAIKNSLEDKQGGILVPFVTNINEFKEFKEILKARNFDKKVGVIVDNPSSIQLVKEYFSYGLDLVVIDFDKIIESLLMVDLENDNFPKFFNLNNSAVFNQIEYLIRVCKRNNAEIKVKFSKLDKDVLEFFVKKEVDSFLGDVKFFNELSEFVKKIEEEVIDGTDREPREYEVKKEMEERNLSGTLEVKKEISEKETTPQEVKADEEEKKEVVSEYSVEDLISSKKKEGDSLEKEKDNLDNQSPENVEENLSNKFSADSEKESLEELEEEHEEIKEEGEIFDSEIEDVLVDDKDKEEEGEEKDKSLSIF